MTNVREKLGPQLIGKRCDNFRFVEGGTLIIYFGHDPRDGESVTSRLWIDCAWRLCHSDRILIGSLNNSDLILTELDKIKSQVLMDVGLDEITKDLRLLFSGDLVIEGFSHSTEDEIWEFRRSDGYRLGVGPDLKAFENFEVEGELQR